MRSYTSLLEELKTECQFQVDIHVKRFKEEVSKGNSSSKAFYLVSDSCSNALSSAGANLLHKSELVGVDDKNKLSEGINSICADYEQKFMIEMKGYLD